jgi:hypothetical protein
MRMFSITIFLSIVKQSLTEYESFLGFTTGGIKTVAVDRTDKSQDFGYFAGMYLGNYYFELDQTSPNYTESRFLQADDDLSARM